MGRQSGSPRLPGVEVWGYRGLRHLRIDRLGQVSLVVGRNNTGKSTLLEALRLFTSRASPLVIRDILMSRDEIVGNPALSTEISLQAPLIFESLFSRPLDGQAPPIESSIRIAAPPLGTLLIQLGFYATTVDEQGRPSWSAAPPGSPRPAGPERVGLYVALDDQLIRFLPLDQDLWYSPLQLSQYTRAGAVPEMPTVFVPAAGIDDDLLVRLYDSALLNGLDEDALSSIRIIDPDAKRLFFVSVQPEELQRVYGQPNMTKRVALLQTGSSSRAVPLRSREDGMNRLFGIALALVNAQNGFLLIDEVENGVHYSVQERMWTLILDLAHRLNVRVFATSHSWDCLTAFERAANANTDVDGVLVRLEKRGVEVRSVRIDESELEVAARRQIEVR